MTDIDEIIVYGEDKYKSGEIDLALKIFINASEKYKDCRIHNNIAAIYWEKGLYYECFRELANTLKINPEDEFLNENIRLIKMKLFGCDEELDNQ